MELAFWLKQKDSKQVKVKYTASEMAVRSVKDSGAGKRARAWVGEGDTSSSKQGGWGSPTRARDLELLLGEWLWRHRGTSLLPQCLPRPCPGRVAEVGAGGSRQQRPVL